MNITMLAIQRERAAFFCRAAQYWQNEHHIMFLTTQYHVYRYIKKRNFTVNMLQDFIDEGISIDEFIASKSEATLMECKANLLTLKSIDKQFNWLCKGFKNYFTQNSVDRLIIWNGAMLPGHIAAIVANSFNVQTLFFEIGNFPNKIFIDPQGVNAKSSLMDKDLSICEEYSEERLVSFLEKHKRSKEIIHIVPQKQLMEKINYFAAYDLIYNMFSRYPLRTTNDNVIKRILKKTVMNNLSIKYDKVNHKETDYVLFPLQVSIDSQVLLNSDTTIEDSINYALNAATENNLALFIKPHPAEKNKRISTYIKELKKKHNNLYVTNINTYQLIKHSRKVITINSTVGIEALMYYKHVEVLGRAFYKPYCEPDLSKPVDKNKINSFLYNYLFNCLRDGDYFGKSDVQIEIS
jgi:capsular polysaccharide export protein